MDNVTPFPPTEQQKELQERAGHFSDYTLTLCLMLNATGCPSKIRGFVHIALFCNPDRRNIWTEVDDLEMARYCCVNSQPVSARRWLKRYRDATIEWNNNQVVDLFECEPGPRGSGYTRYRAPILDLLDEATELGIRSSKPKDSPERRDKVFTAAVNAVLSKLRPRLRLVKQGVK